ncbi:DUF4251 domain-containing protein [Nonlabens ponticola]|uniref:DUF4251 domain-containing protein n=1 Tax=Nonlabens ponticola TaxID=2496866 RepID=A0A3S9MYM4_9FLAO|nr:DUF4251 domain-containing protein [Nonlabens ponticola]AZQ44356.1 DUF4251 domain-containing protein [Nonlabens ponticola]
MRKMSKSLQWIGLSMILAVISSCSVQKTGTTEEWQELQAMINSGELRIEAQAAYPSNTYASQQVINQVLTNTGDSAARIDISGDGHFMQIGNDQVMANLPFYGERRQAGSYAGTDGDTGIVFEDSPDDYEISADDNKRRYDISFEVNQGTENYNVDLILFANKNAVIYVNSNQRTRMEYRGTINSVSQD